MLNSFRQCFERLEKLALYIITAKRKHHFWCDGKIRLCVACQALRHTIKHHRMPTLMIIRSHHGKYLWQNGNYTIRKFSSKASTELTSIFQETLP